MYVKYGRLDTFKYLPEGCTFDEKEIKEGATKCIGKGHNNWCPTGYKPGTGLNNNNVVPLTNPYHYSDFCVNKRKDDACEYTWSTWSPCDEDCGGGIQTRNINIIKNPKNGGEACPPSTEEQSCNTSPCPIDCDYTWSTWSPCDEDCGGGIQTRNINITKNSEYGGSACPPPTEEQSCNTFPCPVDISGGINDDNIRELVKLYLNENNADGVERLTLRNKEDIIKNLGPISEWDVSKVTNMDQLFKNAKNFNEDISKWNVSNVKSMEGTFENATEFNQNINDWDVSKVENMNDLFKNASKFNEDISKWNVSNVKSMEGAFENATEFNQNISDWNVSKVENHENIFKNDVAIKSKYKPIFKCNSSSDCEKNYKCKNGKCVENKLKLEIIIGIIVGSIIVIFFIIFAIIKSKRKIVKHS
jgi:surface protein